MHSAVFTSDLHRLLITVQESASASASLNMNGIPLVNESDLDAESVLRTKVESVAAMLKEDEQRGRLSRAASTPINGVERRQGQSEYESEYEYDKYLIDLNQRDPVAQRDVLHALLRLIFDVLSFKGWKGQNQNHSDRGHEMSERSRLISMCMGSIVPYIERRLALDVVQHRQRSERGMSGLREYNGESRSNGVNDRFMPLYDVSSRDKDGWSALGMITRYTPIPISHSSPSSYSSSSPSRFSVLCGFVSWLKERMKYLSCIGGVNDSDATSQNEERANRLSPTAACQSSSSSSSTSSSTSSTSFSWTFRLASLLLELGADPNSVSQEFPLTPLLILAGKSSRPTVSSSSSSFTSSSSSAYAYGFAAWFDLLLSHGADLSSLPPSSFVESDGGSFLHRLVTTHNLTALSILFTHPRCSRWMWSWDWTGARMKNRSNETVVEYARRKWQEKQQQSISALNEMNEHHDESNTARHDAATSFDIYHLLHCQQSVWNDFIKPSICNIIAQPDMRHQPTFQLIPDLARMVMSYLFHSHRDDDHSSGDDDDAAITPAHATQPFAHLLPSPHLHAPPPSLMQNGHGGDENGTGNGSVNVNAHVGLLILPLDA